MRMWLVVIIWGQTIIKGPSTRADAFNHAVLHQQVKNAVDGHSVYRAAPFQDLIDVTGRKGKSVISYDFQDAHPIRCRL
jgi:hypothetical protein